MTGSCLGSIARQAEGLRRPGRRHGPGACLARRGQLKLAPAEIATAMIMAASQSTVTQNGGHQRVLATCSFGVEGRRARSRWARAAASRPGQTAGVHGAGAD